MQDAQLLDDLLEQCLLRLADNFEALLELGVGHLGILRFLFFLPLLLIGVVFLEVEEVLDLLGYLELEELVVGE